MKLGKEELRARLVRFAIIAVGLALLLPAPITLVSPQLAASSFGVPASTDESVAYLLATGTRDVALGVWLLSLVALGAQNRLLAVSCWSIAIVAVGDALNVGTFTQWQSILVLAPHLLGVVVLLGLGWWHWSLPKVSGGLGS